MSAWTECLFQYEIGLLLHLKIACIVDTKPNFPLCQPHQVWEHLVPALSMGLITSPLALPYWDSWFSIWRASEKAPLSSEGPLVVGCFVLLSPSNLASTLSLFLHLWGWVMKWVMLEDVEGEAQAEAISYPGSSRRMCQRFLLSWRLSWMLICTVEWYKIPQYFSLS